MTLHRNARTCPNSRRLIADRVLGGGWTLAAAAEAAGVSVPTARKWVRRFRELGDAGAPGSLLGAEADPASHSARA